MRHIHVGILALALLLLMSTACSSFPWIVTGRALLSQKPPSAQPTPRAPQFPRGRFSSLTAPNMVLLSIGNDGSFQIFVDNDLLDSGTFEANGSQVLVDSMTCGAWGHKPAPYNWRYDEEEGLAFQPVAVDPCSERSQYLSEEYVPKYMFVFNIPDRGPSKEWLW